jgi:hypothetical protein
MSNHVSVPLYNRAGEVVAEAVIDQCDSHLVLGRRWRRTAYGYAITGAPLTRTDILMHRLILGLERGDRRQGDHRNGDRLDNRRENLRIVTNAQNAQNQSSKGGASKHRGVSYIKGADRWIGYVKVNGRRHSTRRFTTEAEAAAATRALRAELMPFDEPSRHEQEDAA